MKVIRKTEPFKIYPAGEVRLEPGQTMIINVKEEATATMLPRGRKNPSKITFFDDGAHWPLNHQVHSYTAGKYAGDIWISNGKFAGHYPPHLFPRVMLAQMRAYAHYKRCDLAKVLSELTMFVKLQHEQKITVEA